jgi:hypothetical protein
MWNRREISASSYCDQSHDLPPFRRRKNIRAHLNQSKQKKTQAGQGEPISSPVSSVKITNPMAQLVRTDS